MPSTSLRSRFTIFSRRSSCLQSRRREMILPFLLSPPCRLFFCLFASLTSESRVAQGHSDECAPEILDLSRFWGLKHRPRLSYSSCIRWVRRKCTGRTIPRCSLATSKRIPRKPTVAPFTVPQHHGLRRVRCSASSHIQAGQSCCTNACYSGNSTLSVNRPRAMLGSSHPKRTYRQVFA